MRPRIKAIIHRVGRVVTQLASELEGHGSITHDYRLFSL